MTHTEKNAFGESWWADINGQAFRHTPSSQVFKQTYGDIFSTPNQFYLVAGSDSALLANYVARNYCGEGRKFLFIEPDEVFGRLDVAHFSSNCIEFVKESAFSFSELEDRYPEYFLHNRFITVRSLAVLDQINPSYVQPWENLQTQIKLYSYEQANRHSTRKFYDTQLYDVPYNEIEALKLKDTLENKSVLVLAGGPTLDTGIEWIKQHRNQLIIAAVGRIAKRLQQEGIQPDFYATVDPNDVSYDNTKWMTQEDNAMLIHSSYTHPALLAEFMGPHCYTDLRYPWETEQNPENIVTAGPTVTNTILSILTHLAPKNIYLLGVDLCYGPQGETHESSSLEAKQKGMGHSSDLEVETYSGRLALTNTVFFEAYRSLKQFAEQLHQLTPIRLWQLGKESAKILSIPLVTFEDVQLNDGSNHAIDEIKTRLTIPDEQHQYWLKTQREEIQKKIKHVKSFQQLAQDGKKIAQKLFDNLDKLDQQTQKIIKLKKKLGSEKYGWLQQFLYEYALKNYADFLSPQTSAGDEQTREEIKQDLINYFSALDTTASDFLNALNKALDHINNHLDEHDLTKFQKCATYWLNHQQEGRIRIWLKQHGLTLDELNPEDQALAKLLLQNYEQKLHNEQETQLAVRLKAAAESMEHQLKTLQEHFENKNIEGVKVILSSLEGRDTPRAQAAYALAKGYLLELEGATEKAIEFYTQVEEQDLLSLALNRIAKIAFEQKDIELAMNALELLTQFDDRYFIAYANMLLALQDPAGALQIYDHYLQKHLDDYGVWLKAAKAALSGGDTQAAQQCLDEVIQKADEPALIEEAQKLSAQIRES